VARERKRNSERRGEMKGACQNYKRAQIQAAYAGVGPDKPPP